MSVTHSQYKSLFHYYTGRPMYLYIYLFVREERHVRDEQRRDETHHEEQRRSSRQRKSVYSSYNETDITTPYTWRKSRRNNVEFSAADDQVRNAASVNNTV